MSREARFSLWFFTFVIAAAALVAAVNIVADPYLVFGRPRIVGFNALKPASGAQERWMKAYDAPRHAAATIVLGSSRAAVGFDPLDPAWPDRALPVYNLSLAASKTRENLLYLEHVVALGDESTKPRTIFVGLDFESFLSPPERAALDARQRPTRGGDDQERMATVADGSPNPDRRLRMTKDYLAAALSLDAISETIAMIIENRRARPRAPNLEANGHFAEAGFATLVGNDGVSQLFDENNRQFVAGYGVKRQVLDTIAIDDAISALLTFAKQHAMHVVLFLQPSHADHLELTDKIGYWDEFETWKRDITRLVAAYRRDGLRVDLWDFAGYEAYEQESVPDDADRRARLRWFWDPVHYTTALGSRMIARMMTNDAPADFGVELTPDTVEQRIAQVRAARDRYRAGATRAGGRLDRLVCDRMACPLLRPGAQPSEVAGASR